MLISITSHLTAEIDRLQHEVARLTGVPCGNRLIAPHHRPALAPDDVSAALTVTLDKLLRHVAPLPDYARPAPIEQCIADLQRVAAEAQAMVANLHATLDGVHDCALTLVFRHGVESMGHGQVAYVARAYGVELDIPDGIDGSVLVDTQDIDTLAALVEADESKAVEVIRMLTVLDHIRSQTKVLPSQIKAIYPWMAVHASQHAAVMQQHRVSVEMFRLLGKDSAKVLGVEFKELVQLKQRLAKSPDIPEAPQAAVTAHAGVPYELNLDAVLGLWGSVCVMHGQIHADVSPQPEADE